MISIFRSIFSSGVSDESETVEPFSRADILYNRSVDKLAVMFETGTETGRVPDYSSFCIYYNLGMFVVS